MNYVLFSVAKRKMLKGYILNHWNGEQNLAKAFWLNVICFFIIIQFIIAEIHNTLPTDANYQDIIQYVMLIIPTLIGSLIVLIWQVVGIWKSTKNRSRRFFDKRLNPLIKGTLVILIIFHVTQIFLHYSPTKQYLLMALKIDNISKQKNKFKVIADTVYFSGSINFETAKALKKILNQNPSIKNIELSSSGGYINSAHNLVQVITKHNLNTKVSSSCHSACTIAFLGGKGRFITPKANMGFHHPFMPGIPQYITLKANYKLWNLMKQKGIPQNFITKIFEIGPQNLWFPSKKELLKSGYATHIYN